MSFYLLDEKRLCMPFLKAHALFFNENNNYGKENIANENSKIRLSENSKLQHKYNENNAK